MTYLLTLTAVLVVIAELGDKTQLLTLGMAAKYRPSAVLLGVAIGSLLIHGLSVLVGGLIGELLPTRLVAFAAAALFVGFGIWTLRGDDAEEETSTRVGLGPVLTVTVAFFLAELGDKTQLASMAIAAGPDAAASALGSLGPQLRGWLGEPVTGWMAGVSVWLGATLGMVIADSLAIVVGAVLGRQLPQRTLRRVSGVVFVVFGILTFIGAWLGS